MASRRGGEQGRGEGGTSPGGPHTWVGEGKGAAAVEGLADTQKVKHDPAAAGLDTRPRNTKPVQRHIHNSQKAEMTKCPPAGGRIMQAVHGVGH